MKSILLSTLVSVALFGSFMQLFDNRAKAFLNNVPTWVGIVFVIVCFVGYVVAFYWGITGMAKGHRMANLGGICISVFGICCFIAACFMSSGNGKESAGQFGRKYEDIDPAQLSSLDSLLKQTNAQRSDVQFLAYWKLNDSPAFFAVCVQDKNIIGLQIKNRKLTDLSPIADFKKLCWLTLSNCSLTSLKDLNTPSLERLSVHQNNIADFDNIHWPQKIGWIDISGNPGSDSARLQVPADHIVYVTK